MSVAQVILCERTGIWATVLRGQLSPEVHLVQPGDLATAESMATVECLLAARPGSVVALALTKSNRAAVLKIVCRLNAQYPRACTIILAESAMASWELLFREAGAVHFCASPRDVSGISQTLENHFRRQPSPTTDLAQSIWDELPWRDAATA
ncbi:MAG: hypothetical protein AB7O59_07385 [Pirellulales bacterium]